MRCTMCTFGWKAGSDWRCNCEETISEQSPPHCWHIDECKVCAVTRREALQKEQAQMEQEELLCNPVAVQLSRANAMVLELRALAEDIELTEKDSYPSEPIIKLLRQAATKIEQHAHMITGAGSAQGSPKRVL